MIDTVSQALSKAASSLQKRISSCETEIKSNISKYLNSEDNMFADLIGEMQNIQNMQNEMLKEAENPLKDLQMLQEEFLKEAESGTPDVAAIQNDILSSYTPVITDDIDMSDIFGGDQND